jgi:hypothetical protein
MQPHPTHAIEIKIEILIVLAPRQVVSTAVTAIADSTSMAEIVENEEERRLRHPATL